MKNFVSNVINKTINFWSEMVRPWSVLSDFKNFKILTELTKFVRFFRF